MIDILAFDKGSVRSINNFGQLRVALSPISKACVNGYYGREIPDGDRLGLDPDRVYPLLRHPDELAKAVSSFNGIPLFSTHRPTSANDHPKEITVGALGSDAAFDGTYLTNSISVWDAEAISGIESGRQRELSSSYSYEADMTPGEYQGVPYLGIMRNIRANHCALVVQGRAGPDVLVSDSKPTELLSMKKTSLKAFAILGALQVTPKLANDSAVDVSDLLVGVTDAQLASLKPVVLKRCEGKLAADALVELGKRYDEIVAMDSDDDETEEERKAREAKEADKSAKDGDPDDKEDDDEDDEEEKKRKAANDKKAMDAAIKVATDSAVAKVKTDTIKQMQDLRAAEKMVQPLVGELAMDGFTSDHEVYALALKTKGIDIAGVDKSAYPALVRMALSQQSAKPVTLAADSAGGDSFAKRFGGSLPVQL